MVQLLSVVSLLRELGCGRASGGFVLPSLRLRIGRYDLSPMLGALLDLVWRENDSPEPNARFRRRLRAEGLVVSEEGG